MGKKLPKKLTRQQLINIVKKLQMKLLDSYKKEYKCCPKRVYLKYERSQNYQKIVKKRDKSLFNYLKSLKRKIVNIRKAKKASKIRKDEHVYKIINHKIGNKMEGKQFMEGVNKSIKVISQTWPKEKIITLKKKLDEFDFTKLDFDKDYPLSNLKKDSLLDLLLYKGKEFKATNIDLKNLGIKNCAKCPLTNGIQFFDPNSGTNRVLNKEFILKKITTNIGIVNAFYKMIQKFTEVKFLDYKELIAYIEDIVLTTNIYFCDLPLEVCGVTISNGDIYIAGEYLSEALGETDDYKGLKTQYDRIYYKFTAICKIYLKLLHEYAHKLHYVIREKYHKTEWEENFFDHSEMLNSSVNLDYFQEIGKHSNIGIFIPANSLYSNIHDKSDSNESGNFFDRELYLGFPFEEVNPDICDFYLSKRCLKYTKYINAINNLKNKVNDPTLRRQSNSRFKIIKAENCSKCYFSVLRNC